MGIDAFVRARLELLPPTYATMLGNDWHCSRPCKPTPAVLMKLSVPQPTMPDLSGYICSFTCLALSGLVGCKDPCTDTRWCEHTCTKLGCCCRSGLFACISFACCLDGLLVQASALHFVIDGSLMFRMKSSAAVLRSHQLTPASGNPAGAVEDISTQKRLWCCCGTKLRCWLCAFGRGDRPAFDTESHLSDSDSSSSGSEQVDEDLARHYYMKDIVRHCGSWMLVECCLHRRQAATSIWKRFLWDRVPAPSATWNDGHSVI